MQHNEIQNVVIKGTNFSFSDRKTSMTVGYVANEINSEEYALAFDDKIKFEEGDAVIDVGGNVGVFSIFLAKKFPFLKIYSFEPVFENWKNFKRNMKINNVGSKNIKLFNCAVSGDGKLVKLETDAFNTGASSMIKELTHRKNTIVKRETVKSITLDQVLLNNGIEKCKLLKIDCEGAEFEIFYNSKLLDRIEYITGETHSFDEERNNRKFLLEYLSNNFDENKIQFSGW